MSDATTHAWIQLKAERNPYTGEARGAKVVRVTQNKPTVTDPDVRVVKIKFTIPTEAFDDEIAASITIPQSAVQKPEIVGEVEAEEKEGDQ